MENNFHIRLLEYGIKNEEGFNYKNIADDEGLSLTEDEKKAVERYMENAHNNLNSNFPHKETPFLCIYGVGGHMNENAKYTLTLDANFKYIDYLELKQARKAAEQARKAADYAFKAALAAIAIASAGIIIELVFNYYWAIQTISKGI